MSFIQAVKGGVFAGVAMTERFVNSRSSASFRDVRNFLLLQYPAALGTALHATPLIPALRHAVPGCSIVVAGSGFGLDVFRSNPGIDKIIETANPLYALKKAVSQLRRENPFAGSPYVTLTSTGNERTKIALQAMLSGAAVRVGFTVVPQLYRVPLAYDPGLSQIANNLRIIEALGHASRHFEPEIFFSEEDLKDARAFLARSGVRPNQPVVVFVTQTSVAQRKGWRPERFRAVARFLVERYDAHVLFIGTSKEAPMIDKLRRELEFSTTSIAGKTSLSQLAAFMRLCKVGLTLDTGPMHIGRSVGLPMVIIAPAWSPPVEWLPICDPRFRILKNADIPFAPTDYIIDEVSVKEVTEALSALMENPAKG